MSLAYAAGGISIIRGVVNPQLTDGLLQLLHVVLHAFHLAFHCPYGVGSRNKLIVVFVHQLLHIRI